MSLVFPDENEARTGRRIGNPVAALRAPIGKSAGR
jgi:hypothetical protein